MLKKRVALMISLLVLSVFFGQVSFAFDLTKDFPTGVTKDAAMSQQALGLAKQQFTALKVQLTALAADLPPDQQAALENAVKVLDAKLAALDRIDVYFTAEKTPGEAFTEIYNFYKANLALEDIGNADLQFAVTQVPAGLLPTATQETLTNLLNQNKVRAAAGSAGQSRLSILTVYVNPTTFEVIQKTTIVIATDK